MERKEYNGWTNYETWLVSLWMDNEEGSYEYWQERAQECFDAADADEDKATYALSDEIKERHEEIVEEATPENGFIADLIGAAMSEVNWYEIAEHLINDVDKPEPDTDSEEIDSAKVV